MRRLLFVDDNIRSLDGHYFELATLLCDGARALGYHTELATHVDFNDAIDSNVNCHPVFTARPMLAWSLGVDGRSSVSRDAVGRPVGGNVFENLAQRLRDRITSIERHPQRLIRQWSQDLTAWLHRSSVTTADTLVINTGNDFTLLALANSLRTLGKSAPAQTHVLFHFAVHNGDPASRRARYFGEQVRSAVQDAGSSKISLHTSTEPLSAQFRSVGLDADAIPYPTRSRASALNLFEYGDTCVSSLPLKIVLAGLPRREKGAKSIARLLLMIEQPFLDARRFSVSLQLAEKKWKRIVPESLLPRCVVNRAVNQSSVSRPALEIFTSHLSTPEYQSWLDSADVGLFLYDSSRYVARCSGVLLEMLIRGVPVIVPDGCWLEDQIRIAGGDGSVGYIYESIDEIPALLDRMLIEYESMRQRARRYASQVATRHHPQCALTAMGIKPVSQASAAA